MVLAFAEVIHTLSTDPSRSVVLVKAEKRPDAAAIAAEFSSPPITEVSLAVSFQPLDLGLMAVADLWRDEFRKDFPKVQEQAPIRLPQERFEASPAPVPAFSFEMVATPALPRFWFLNEPGTELLQVQPDWFARNWRQTDEAKQPYPLYASTRDAFAKDFGQFVEFVAKRDLGPVVPVQAEITYINHIEEPELSNVLTAVGRVTDIPSPEATAFNVQYVLVKDEHPVGRLYLQASTAIHRTTSKPISALTITARGRPIGDGIQGAMAFLDFGAIKALEAFIHSTRPEMHAKWRRK